MFISFSSLLESWVLQSNEYIFSISFPQKDNLYGRLLEKEKIDGEEFEKIFKEKLGGIEVYAEKEAKEAFELMCIDASTIGLIIKTISAYRSYDYQKNLYEKYYSR